MSPCDDQSSESTMENASMQRTRCIVLMVICALVRVKSESGEPVCYSRFDYDEKMLSKLMRIEDEVQKFRKFIDDLKTTQETEEHARKSALDKTLLDFKENTDIYKEGFSQQMAEMLNSLNDTKQSWNTQMTNLMEKANKKETVVAFTVTTPTDGSTSSTIVFTDVITNEGGMYSPKTGVFTCTVPGLYYFSLSLVKKRSSTRIDQVHCSIIKNRNTVVSASIDPADAHADIGSYGVSTVALIRLAKGDLVDLGGCSDASSMETRSTFSGLLVKN